VSLDQLHHLATQQDNRLNQHIGNVTTQVALQTQRDSASMFTLAVVTTIFLPPTFVAVRIALCSPTVFKNLLSALLSSQVLVANRHARAFSGLHFSVPLPMTWTYHQSSGCFPPLLCR